MAWYSGLFGDTSGLSDQDQQNIANQGLLRAGLGILAANGRPGTTPFQALSSGLLGGLDSVQQGAEGMQNSRYKQAIMQSTMANMQNAQASAKREADQRLALHQALANNTDPSGNIDIAGAVREYGKKYPEDAANALVQLHGGKPDLKDTSQGALQVYPDGYNAYLQAGGLPQGVAQQQAPQATWPGLLGTYNPPPPLLDAVKQVESGGNPNAVSPKGATGLMQVMPGTAANPGFGITPSNGTPQDTVRVGQQYLGALINKYGQTGGVAAYNWGPGNLDRALASNGGNLQSALATAPAETQNYVPKVLAQAGGGSISQGGMPQLPAGRISLTAPSKTVNADDQKYQRIIDLGYPKDVAAEAAYGVKPSLVASNAPAVPMPDGNLPNGQQYLDQLPPARKQLAQAVIDGRYPIPKGFSLKNPQSWQLVQDVVQADPQFDTTNFDARANAAKQFTSATSPNAPANQIRSVQTIANHLQTISAIMPKLDLSSFGAVNQAKNWLSSKQGKTDPEYTRALGSYQQAAKSIGDETAKLFAGTGSALADREHVAQMLDPSQPKEKLQGSLGTLADLIQGRLDAINEQAITALGPLAASRLKIISPEQQRTLESIKSLAGNALYGKATPVASPSIQPPIGIGKSANRDDPLGILK